MSGEDDTRILGMQINNKDFLKGTADSLKALDSLNKGIDSAGKGKGMQDLGKNVETVKTKFGALQIAGVTALANITNRAVNAGINLAKSFTFAPIMDGFREYEKLLKSTQTIAANTGLTGAKGLVKVEAALDNLNKYSDQTIYNFGQMADSIGKFTAAGGKGSLMPSVDAIKGLANSAALAGSDVNQLNTAMYQMSQAMSTGVIKLMDWNSLANAGMGGKNMQMVLKMTARSFGDAGKPMDDAINKMGSFRESLSEGWLNTDIFSKGMKVMGGVTSESFKSIDQMRKLGYDKSAISALQMGKSVAFSVKQLRKMGYSKDAAKALNKLSNDAIQSATKIKTFTQLIDVVKESIGSGWAVIFRGLFGNLKEAGDLWTNVGNRVTGAIDRIFGSMGEILEQWRDLGGYTKLWGAFGNIFQAIGNLLRPFVVLFQSLFPATDSAGSSLYTLTDAFYQFSVWLEKATRGTGILTPVITVLAGIIKFLWGILSQVVVSFFDLLMVFAPLGKAVGGLVSKVGELVEQFDLLGKAQNGIDQIMEKFSEGRIAAVEPLVKTVTALVNAIQTLVSGDVSGFKEQFRDAFGNLDAYVNMFNTGVSMASDMVAGLRQGWASGDIQSTISDFVDRFVNFFKDLLGIHSPSTLFEGFGTNIVEGLVNGIRAGLGAIGGVMSDLGGAIADGFSGLDKYDLANIFSVIFGGAVFVILFRFIRALQMSMTTFKGFAENLMGDDGLLGQTTKTMQTMQTGIRAKAILNISLALLALAGALWILSKIPYANLGVGLVAIGALMAMLTATMMGLAKSAGTMKMGVITMTSMSAALIGMAGAILLLAGAIYVFGKMPTDVLKQGMISVGIAMVAMTALGLALGKASPFLIAAAAAMAIVSVSLLVLASALVAFAGVMKLYEKMDWATIGGGMLKMGVVLVGLGIAMAPLAAMAPGVLIAAAALVVLSVGLTSMLGVIMLFSKISWGTFGKGLGMIAAALVAIGLAAIAAAPGLLLLGVAALALGVGLLAAGTGMTLLGAGFAVLAAAGVAGGAALVAAVEAFLAILPLMGVQLVAALTAILGALADKSPEIVDSLVKIGTELLRGLSELIPEYLDMMEVLIRGLLDKLVELTPEIATAGGEIVLALLEKIEDMLPDFIDSGVAIVEAWIEGIGDGASDIVTTAGETLLKFLNALDAAIQIYAPQISPMGLTIAGHLIEGLVKGLVPQPVLDAFTGFVDQVVSFFKGLLGINSPSTVFMAFGRDIVMGLVNGIRNTIGLVTTVIANLVNKVVTGAKQIPTKVKNALSNLGAMMRQIFTSAFNTAVNAVTSGVNKISSAVGKIPGILSGVVRGAGSAAKSVGSSIVNGIKNGLGSAVQAVGDLGSALKEGIKSAINSALNLPLNIPKIHIDLPGPKNIDFGGKTVIPAFAKGVTGFGGGAALVGEAGPELVTMGRGSNVITNELLTKFIKQVNALTRSLSASPGGKNSPGGNIAYVVSADFRGNPKADGARFAADIAAGLILGMRAQQSGVDSTMVNLADGMSQSFADTLGIASPSKVFKKYAGDVGRGFINGLLASVNGVKDAAKHLGNAAINAIAQTVTDGQLKLEAVRAKANAYENAADALRAKAKKTKDKEEKRRLEARAKVYDKLAKKEGKAAAAQDRKVQAEEAKQQWDEDFKNADTAGKADMIKQKAIASAESASALREKAIRLEKEADLVRKYDKKRAAELDKQAKAALAQSKKKADASEKYALEAKKLGIKAQTEAEQNDDIDSGASNKEAQMKSVTAEDVLKAQRTFEGYSKAMREANAAAQANLNGQEIKFEQNNYSPEALSPSETYRNGKSLVSLAQRKLVPTP